MRNRQHLHGLTLDCNQFALYPFDSICIRLNILKRGKLGTSTWTAICTQRSVMYKSVSVMKATMSPTTEAGAVQRFEFHQHSILQLQKSKRQRSVPRLPSICIVVSVGMLLPYLSDSIDLPQRGAD